MARNGKNAFRLWGETCGDAGTTRPVYASMVAHLDGLARRERQALDERLEATMREMGVTFGISHGRPWGSRPWTCDLLPQIFTGDDWDIISRGLAQRLRAFEHFLRDIYGPKEILRAGVLPVKPVLGSTFRQRAAEGIPLPQGAFLHLSGAAICRLPDGRMAFKHHYFGNASGISYMMQNRRALSRVIPQSFGDLRIRSIAGVPGDILDSLRALSPRPDPTVVLLSPGPSSAAHSEHGFLARRMGIPLVQGGDLVVLHGAVHLKTVGGLDRVDVIYSRLADAWLDPLTFRRDSLIGVPGIAQCMRQGAVVLVNGVGTQLADDRSLLAFAPAIIRFYLGERPVMPQLPTYWLGDIDQREMVLEALDRYTVRPVYGEKILLGGDARAPGERALASARRLIAANSTAYVAQPQDCDAMAITFHDGRKRLQRQDHIVFALRQAHEQYEVIPGALTRTTTVESHHTSSELGGGSKDTWVEMPEPAEEPPIETGAARRAPLPAQMVGSRAAEAFYWLGRYLERAAMLAGMIRGIESLEVEELNPTERTLYRPVWNRMLPPLESPAGVTRRTLSSPAGRQRLTLDMREPDSVASAVSRAGANGGTVFDLLSLEAWGVLERLRRLFRRRRIPPAEVARQACRGVVEDVPEFFGVLESTVVADGALALSQVGRMLERAIVTANALCSISGRREMGGGGSHETEIELSAFLRLLASRDVYRRVYQMRIEPGPVVELLWSNPKAPRSVARCLGACAELLRASPDLDSPATERTIASIGAIVSEVRRTDWHGLATHRPAELQRRGAGLLAATLDLHHAVSDSFLNLQIHIRATTSTAELGLKDAL